MNRRSDRLKKVEGTIKKSVYHLRHRKYAELDSDMKMAHLGLEQSPPRMYSYSSDNESEDSPRRRQVDYQGIENVPYHNFSVDTVGIDTRVSKAASVIPALFEDEKDSVKEHTDEEGVKPANDEANANGYRRYPKRERKPPEKINIDTFDSKTQPNLNEGYSSRKKSRARDPFDDSFPSNSLHMGWKKSQSWKRSMYHRAMAGGMGDNADSGEEYGGVDPLERCTIYDEIIYSYKNLDFVKKSGGSMLSTQASSGHSEARPSTLEVDFDLDDIGGVRNHVIGVKEALAGLLRPEVFKNFGIKLPKGLLFYGPPGTGKTLMVRAIVGFLCKHGHHVNLFIRKGADILSKYVGEAERQLRLLFDEAQKFQPSIILFDEIDGVAPVRSPGRNQEIASVVATLLALMDGVNPLQQVLVIGTTNRPENLDPALRRPGRFDMEYRFDLPDLAGRLEILLIHTKKWKNPPSISFFREFAKRLEGYTGADIGEICRQAMHRALRKRCPEIFDLEMPPTSSFDLFKVDEEDFLKQIEVYSSSKERNHDVIQEAWCPRHSEFLFSEVFNSVIQEFQQTFCFYSTDLTETLANAKTRIRVQLCGSLSMLREYFSPFFCRKLGLPAYMLDLQSIGSASLDGLPQNGVSSIFRKASARPSAIIVPDLATEFSKMDVYTRACVCHWLKYHCPNILIIFLVIEPEIAPNELFEEKVPYFKIRTPSVEMLRSYAMTEFEKSFLYTLNTYIESFQADDDKRHAELIHSVRDHMGLKNPAKEEKPSLLMFQKTQTQKFEEFLEQISWVSLPKEVIKMQQKEEEALQVKLQCQITEVLSSLAQQFPSIINPSSYAAYTNKTDAITSLSQLYDNNNAQKYACVEDFENDIKLFCKFLNKERRKNRLGMQGSPIGFDLIGTFFHMAMYKIFNIDFPDAHKFYALRREKRKLAITPQHQQWRHNEAGRFELRRSTRLARNSVFPIENERLESDYQRNHPCKLDTPELHPSDTFNFDDDGETSCAEHAHTSCNPSAKPERESHMSDDDATYSKPPGGTPKSANPQVTFPIVRVHHEISEVPECFKELCASVVMIIIGPMTSCSFWEMVSLKLSLLDQKIRILLGEGKELWSESDLDESYRRYRDDTYTKVLEIAQKPGNEESSQHPGNGNVVEFLDRSAFIKLYLSDTSSPVFQKILFKMGGICAKLAGNQEAT